MPSTSSTDPDAPRLDRRARRRQETIEEILAIAVDVMNEQGVNGLSLSEVARRLGVQPPSLYKYFDSLHAVYDAIFERGSTEHLAAMHQAMSKARPGLAALNAGLEAAGRWCLENQAVTQLLFWRPVPNFQPSPRAFEPSQEMVAIQRDALRDAVAANELGPLADSDSAVFLLGTLLSGVIGMALANDPGEPWGKGRFTPLFPKLMELLPALYPPG